MNVVRELVTLLRYKVDNSPLKQYATQAQSVAKGIRAKVDGALSGVRNQLAIQAKLNRYHKNFAESAEIYRKKMQGVNDGLANVKNNLLSLRNLVGGYFAMIAGGSTVRIADEWAAVDSRVKLATKSAEEHKHALNQIFDISQRSGQDYLASADLFSKVNRSAGDLGLSLDDSLNLTEIIGQTMTIGGGDQGAQQAALMQLGQALGSGALRGDELNSIIEQAPRLANAIADSFGVPIGKLKELGGQGKLTSKELAQGLLKQADKIQKEFDQMPKTFGRGMTILKNKAGQLIDVAVNKVSKLGATFYYAAEWVVQNTRLIGILATSAIGAKLLPMLKAVNVSFKQIIVNGVRAAAPFLAMAVALAAVGLMLEDIYVWTQGGISITGGLVGRFDQWAAKFTVIGDMAHLLWSNIKDIAAEFGAIIDFDFSLESWQEFATGTLQYIINGLGNLIELLLNISRFVKRLIKGDFAGAFDIAGDAVGGLSLKFLPFYSVALSAIGGIGSLLWALFSPLKMLGKLFGGISFIVVKAFRIAGAVIKPFISILSFVSKAIFFVSKAFVFASGVIIKAIWSIARAMFMAMASNPILLAITVIIGLVILLIVYWDEVKAFAIATWEAISAKVLEIWESITTSASEMWENIKNKAAEIWDDVKNTAVEKWTAVTNSFKEAWQKSIDTVVDWFNSLIPSWIRDLFTDGAKAEINVTGAVTPTSNYVTPASTASNAVKYATMAANVTQTNNFTIQSSSSPATIANNVAGKLNRNAPNAFGLGQMEYAG